MVVSPTQWTSRGTRSRPRPHQLHPNSWNIGPRSRVTRVVSLTFTASMYVHGSFRPWLINENNTNDAVPYVLMSKSVSVLNNASMCVELHKPLNDFVTETMNSTSQTCDKTKKHVLLQHRHRAEQIRWNATAGTRTTFSSRVRFSGRK